MNIEQYLKPWTCHICGKSAECHGKLCEGIPVYECLLCSKNFKNLTLLKNHQVCHNSDYLSCCSCDKKFKRKSDLKKHEQRHNENVQYECSICGNSLKRKKDLGILHKNGVMFSTEFIIDGHW